MQLPADERYGTGLTKLKDASIAMLVGNPSLRPVEIPEVLSLYVAMMKNQ